MSTEATDRVKQGVALLRPLLTMNQTVYAIERHRTRGGKTRYISLFVARGHGIIDITEAAALALGEFIGSEGPRRGIKLPWDGTDLASRLVFRLSKLVWPTGEAHPFLKREWL